MNKTVIFFGILFVVALASGCQALIKLDPPEPKTEILCESWKAEADNMTNVQAKAE